ncbi:MAG: alpha-L-arabinofuranosidase, partial [Bacteroidales bacterium]|nr:alpha-L-arabinofuranosidase [Bacteroidales bacterium]
ALAEGLYLLHVERNADVVVMTSYAPLFARKNTNNWNPDLIYFDNERPFLTCSYYVQQMFGRSSGDYYYGDCVGFDRPDDKLLGQSVVLDTQSRKLFLKVCNAGEKAAKASIDLSRFGSFKSVTKTCIKGQPDDENGFEAQPVAPVTETVKLKSKATLEVEPYSIVLYTIGL